MLKWISTLEPGIEHAMWENKVGRPRSVYNSPHSEAAVLPNTVNNDRVELPMSILKPLGKFWRVTVAPAPWAKRMDLQWRLGQPWSLRRIETNDFDFVAALKQS